MEGAATVTASGADWLRDVVRAVGSMPAACDDVERIERIRQFEILKSAIAAAQLTEAVAFDVSQRTEQAVAGETSERQGRGVASELGLATAQSPWRARRWLGWGKVLTSELPATFAELRAGHTSEWRALLVARETVWLSREDRAEVDTILGPQLRDLGDRQVENLARCNAQRLDPAGAVERRRVAERERRVTLRPRPDTMTSLSATTTVDRGVAMYAQLRRDADALVGTGQADGRTRDQVMADLVYERVTGRDSATGPAVEVELLISTDTLLGVDTWTDDQSDGWADEVDGPPSAGESGDTPLSVDLTLCHDASMTTTADADAADATDADEDVTRAGNRPPRTVPDPGRTAHSPAGRPAADESALLTADGVVPVPIPAPIARELVADASQLWLRRLFTHPDTGDLIAMESRSRLFSDALKDFIRFRDQYCSTPYCGAPIRHADHAIPAERGGPTSERNGNGKCATCNLAKQAPGWRQIPAGHGRGALVTPTGHTYDLAPPRLPGARPRTDDVIVDVLWRALNCAARRAAA